MSIPVLSCPVKQYHCHCCNRPQTFHYLHLTLPVQGPHSGPLAFLLAYDNLLCELEMDTRHLLLGDKITAKALETLAQAEIKGLRTINGSLMAITSH